MQRHARSAALVVLGMLLVACASGCTSTPVPVPLRAALVGTWVNLRSTLVLRVDGSCTARLIDAGSAVVSGTCSWGVLEDDPPQVRLDFSGDPSAHLVATRYLVDGEGDALTLHQDVGGDPADRWVLTRSG